MADLRSKAEQDMAMALAGMGVKLDAYIFRPAVDWDGPMYGYRLTWPDGSTHVAHLPWGDSTLAIVFGVAKAGPKKGAKK